MAYRWGQVSYKISADVAGKVMEELAEGPGLTAQNLVNVSRPESAPLHSCFEWDDSVAAEHYRENQARHIITSIELIREDIPQEETKPVTIQAFHALRTEENSGYEHIRSIISDEDKRRRLMELAKRDMGIFKDKYAELSELTGVFDEMDKVLEKQGTA